MNMMGKNPTQLIVQALVIQYLWHPFLDPRGSGFGLFGGGEMEEIRALSAGGEGEKCGFQCGELIQFGLEFGWDGHRGAVLKIKFPAGFFELDRLGHIGFDV